MSATMTAPRRSARNAAGDPQVAYVQTIAHFAAQAGLTLEALADRSGVSRDRLTAMARGRAPVGGEDAVTLARVLGCGPQEIRSGPPGAIASGAALLAAHDAAGRKLPGAVLTNADVRLSRYQLGEEDAPPVAPTAEHHAGGGDCDDMPEQPWAGETSWSGVFGDVRCGWCRKRHDGLVC